MKTRWIWIALISMVFGTQGFTASNGSPGTSGDDFPVPFENLNRKVELADGEMYILKGTVVTVTGRTGKAQAYLMVDLNEHPWLGSKYRTRNPYYPLEGAVQSWLRFGQRRVQITCKARAVVSVGPEGLPVQTIFLKPLQDSSIQPLD